MYYLVGFKDGLVKYAFEFKTQEKAIKTIENFRKSGVELSQVTLSQYVEAKDKIERQIWG